MPELNLVERTVTEAGITRARADFEGVVAGLRMERVAHDRRGDLAAIQVEVKPLGPGRTIVGRREAVPCVERELLGRDD